MAALPFSKRAEIEMTETILVLFALVLIIFIGIFVYYRFSVQHVQTVSQELSEQEASVLLATLSRLPEIRCSRDDCLDTGKFLPFSQLSRDSSFYAGLLGSTQIIVHQLYPVVSSEDWCDFAHYQQSTYPDNCRSWVVYDRKPAQPKQEIIYSRPVSLYFPETHTYRIGRLEFHVF